MPPDNEVDIKIEADPEDKQLSLLIDDEAPSPKEKAKPQPKAKPAGDADGGIAALKRENADLAAQRNAEAAARRQAEAEADKARTEVKATQETAINSALAAAKTEADTLQAQITAALESGEYKQAGEIQRKLARAEATILRYEDAKAELEAQKKAAPVEKPAPQQHADPFENYVSKLSPRAQSWMRDHKEYATDQKLNAKLIAAHHVAVSEDYTVDSPAYFERIEEHLGLRDIAADEDVDDGDKPAQEARSPRHSAPVTRDTPTLTSTGTRNRVTLSRAEVEMAEALGMTREEYARYKLKGQKEGRYDRQ